MKLIEQIKTHSNYLLLLLALIIFMIAGFAVHTTTVLQPNDSNNLTGTVGVKFNIVDGNFVAATHDVNVSIAVSATAGAFTTYLIRDQNANTYCGGAANYADVNCTYTFDTTTVADGNYFIDINTTTFATGNTVDQNSVIDSSNSSVSIDNSGPTISNLSPTGGNADPNVVLSLNTNESATCRYDSLNVAYASMDSSTTSGLGTSHSWSRTYSAGQTVSLYFRCRNLSLVSSSVASTTFIVRSAGGGGVVCGDNACNGSETAATCAADCSPVCGDNACTGTESSLNCPADCGTNIVCGNGTCNPGENYNNCPVDCEAPKGQIVKETVLSRTTTGKPSSEDITRILLAAGASENAIQKAGEALSKTSVSRNFDVVKQVDNGKTSYISTVKIMVRNDSGKTLTNVKVVEEIPKVVARNASQARSFTQFAVLKDDPIIEFTVGSIPSGSTATVEYTVDKRLSDSDVDSYAPPIVANFVEGEQTSDLCENLNCNDNNPCTSDSCADSRCLNIARPNGDACGTGLVCMSGQCVQAPVTEIETVGNDTGGILIPVIVVIIVLAGAYYFYRKK